jgi:hypothetical protein
VICLVCLASQTRQGLSVHALFPTRHLADRTRAYAGQQTRVKRHTLQVYHPQVNPDTGELSTSRHFPKWRAGKDKLWHLLKLVRHTFYSTSVKEPVFNREAADLLAQPDGAAR